MTLPPRHRRSNVRLSPPLSFGSRHSIQGNEARNNTSTCVVHSTTMESKLQCSVTPLDRLCLQTLSSNIMAKIPINYETTSYFANADKKFFINLQQRRLSALTLFLTDARNRPLGRQAGSASGTAAGSQTAGVLNSNLQSTQGNLFFTATIRIDVVQASFPQRLQAPPPMLSQPPLNNRGTLIWQDHGTSKYDTA